MAVQLTSGSIVVDADGTKLSYTDSGAPSNPGYITIIIVHGLGFNANVFSAIQPVALANGFRFVAVNRRGYGASTPLTPAELDTIRDGTPDARAELWRKVGVQMLTFVDAFARRHALPVLEDGRKAGGIVLVGWSFGNAVTLSAVANIHAVPAGTRARLAARLRALILQEPPPNLDSERHAQQWMPLSSPEFPDEAKMPLFAQWISAYFDHPNLSARTLEFLVPSPRTPPSIWNDPDGFADAIDAGAAPLADIVVAAGMPEHLARACDAALFDPAVRAALPHMRVSHFVGARAPAFLVHYFWVVKDKAARFGGTPVEFRLVEGANHFVFWDSPRETMDLYRELVA
ncbi:Alpha/Beta hydrolase protein [Vararia minispora EC-137]|uniref:Alpha/Beta hydrolase protein n=1 Tax=Vararia minispora EC-137 TaxID=1314806 RepID=A0ACB8Q6R0_9AGAM|nr:Alpha/Beta hydrolase protein [Vararia minispora EC-137]